MDDLIKQQQKEDFIKLYSLLEQASHGGNVWLTVEHGRTKTLAERQAITSPILKEYKRMTEQQSKGQEEKIKEQNKKIIEQGRTIAEQAKRIKQLENLLKQIRLERDELDAAYCGYIVDIEDKLKEVEQIAEQAQAVHFKGKGKAIEMPPRVIREVVRLWCLGKSIKDIEKETGASRWQIKRVFNGGYKSAASREKILKAINKLLQVNQNENFINKLNELKKLYL